MRLRIASPPTLKKKRATSSQPFCCLVGLTARATRGPNKLRMTGAAPRRRLSLSMVLMRRMSNCVVGSGGSWLPCSTIAEHSVEGCDHFSHDGDDDDLGFFVGVGEAIVEGFEGGTVSACAEGGHVEDVTDRHPTTVDAAVSLELAAVEVIGCEADEGGDLFTA